MKKTAILITSILCLFACEDFIERDLSGSSVEVISPMPEVSITEGEVIFNWELLHGADRYRLIVVTPDFATASNTVCDVQIEPDSVAHNVSHALQLSPGAYQWSVHGLNNSSQSERKINKLTILEDSIEPDISGSSVDVISPVSGITIPEGEIIFNWELLQGADRYRLIVVTPDFASASSTVCDILIDSDATAHNATHTVRLYPGAYQWSVQGLNSNSKSEREINTLTISEDSSESGGM